MRSLRPLAALAVAVVTFVGTSLATPFASAPPRAAESPTIAQFLGAASPLEVVAAQDADRIAWISYDQGKRNVYTAAAPAFAPVRLTAYLEGRRRRSDRT